MPSLILQVAQDALVDRVMTYLHLKYSPPTFQNAQTTPGKESSEHFGLISIYASCTQFSKTSERHILIRSKSSATTDLLQADIVHDANLSAAITRLYRFAGPHAHAFVSVDEACVWLKRLSCLESASVRLLAFPGFVKQQMLQQGGAQQHDAGMWHAEASRGETCVEHAAANLREQHVSEHRRVAEIEGGGEGSRSGGFRWDATAGADWVVSAVFANGYALHLLYWYKSTHTDLAEGALLGA